MEQNGTPTLLIPLVLSLLVTLMAWTTYGERKYPQSEKYLTFWPRFFATYADGLVLWPINSLIPFLLAKSPPFIIGYLLFIILSIGWYLYSILLHSKYGQTVGKMVCKVKVVDFKSEGDIGFRQAILRDLVPILISIPLLIYQSFFILSNKLNISDIYDSRIMFEGGNLHLSLMFWLPMGWFLAEIITMLTNEKRRALHDYIAGTVVMRTRVQG